jgi:hypothetical protein
MNSDGQGTLVRTQDVGQVYGPRGRYLYLSLVSSFYMFAPILVSAARSVVFRAESDTRVGVNG